MLLYFLYDKEKRKTLMKKILAFVLALSALLLCACGGPVLSEDFDEAEIRANMEKFVLLVSDGDFEAARDMFSSGMQEAMTIEDFQQDVNEKLAELGKFEKIKADAIVEREIDGENYAVAAVVCEYEEGSATYTITFDTEGRVCGVYLK